MEGKKSFVENTMHEARKEKEWIIMNILDFQNGHKYSEYELRQKNLSKLRKIWENIQKSY